MAIDTGPKLLLEIDVSAATGPVPRRHSSTDSARTTVRDREQWNQHVYVPLLVLLHLLLEHLAHSPFAQVGVIVLIVGLVELKDYRLILVPPLAAKIGRISRSV